MTNYANSARIARKHAGAMSHARRIFFWTLPVLALWPGALFGDLAVTMKFEHRETLQFEPVRVTLEITNESDTPFIVARDAKQMPELNFHILKEGRRTIARLKEGSILRNLYILPRQKETLTVVLSHWYNMADMGQYLATATIDWEGEAFASNRAVLEIVRGMEVARATLSTAGKPRQRLNCGLRYWRRNKEEHLFLTIQNQAGDVSYGVFSLGPILRVSQPRIETGAQGIIRTMHQTSPNCFRRFVFQVGPEGAQMIKQSLLTADGQPCRAASRPDAKTSAEAQ